MEALKNINMRCQNSYIRESIFCTLPKEKEMKSLREKLLIAVEKNNLSKEEIEQIKAQHLKEYKAAHQQEYKKKSVRKELVFNVEEFAMLKRKFDKAKSQESSLRLGTFLKRQILASFGLVSLNEEGLEAFTHEARKIGNNINQLVRYVHTQNFMTLSDFEALLERVDAMEESFHQAMKKPDDIFTVLRAKLNENPNLLPKFQEILKEHANDSV